MTTKAPYSYVVLRYIHDVLTEEFVNVGLVMAVPSQSRVLTKARTTFGRIKNVFPDLDSDAYKRAVRAIERGMEQVDKDLRSQPLLNEGKSARDFARIALPIDDSALQWSQVGVGLTADPEKTFDQLYQRFVAQYDRRSPKRKSDEDVWKLVSNKLKEREVSVEMMPKRIVGETDSVEFQHAWKNGRWHVYEPLSFDLSDADNIKDKARRWLGHLTAVGDVADDVQIHFIVGRPESQALIPAFENALRILEQSPHAEVFREDEIDTVVHRIEDEVRQHQAIRH